MNDTRTTELERQLADQERTIEAQRRTIEALMDAAESRQSGQGASSFALWQQHVGLAQVVDRKTRRLRDALDQVNTLHESLTRKTEELEAAVASQRAIVEALDANVCILDGEGAVIETNAYWGAFALQNEDIHAAVEAALAGGDETNVLDTPYQGPDGRWFQVRVCPMGRGGHGWVMLAYIDVTDLLAVERALAEKSEEAAMLALVAQHTDSAVVIVNAANEIIWVNESFTAQSGFTPEDALGQHPTRLLLAPEEQHAQEARIAASVASGQGFSVEARCVGKSGRAYPVEVETRFILGEDGTLHRAIGIFRDVSARKQAEARLAQAERLESIGQLAAGVAHEINTPMQYIGDNLTFLKRSTGIWREVVEQLRPAITDCPSARALLDDRRMRFIFERAPRAIDQALEGVGAVSSIVAAMKAVSHISSGDERAPTDLNRCVETALTVGRNEWKYVANVEPHLADELPEIDGDAGALGQVILNLLVNAAHAIADVVSGDERGRITVSTRHDRDAGDVVLEIADTGTGMPPEVLSRIFDPFYTTKEVGKGTGQGLALAHNIIVKRHGGSIDVASTPGAGTVFTVRLPVCAAAASRDGVAV